MEIYWIMKKFKGASSQTLLITTFLLVIILLLPSYTHADSITENALNFLKSKQDSTGKITTGFSAPSQWSAIAFTVNGVDISTVKNSNKSLKEFLLTDVPGDQSSATDWENRILAIVAIGEDPTNFGEVNYVQKLEAFYNNNQIGDACSLNDDVFGLLALVAAGNSSTTQIKQDTLNFLIQKQDSSDGGFGFSAPGCSWYSTSADMTGAAIQALQATKDNGLTNSDLDDSITKAKNYLLANQNPDGGFGYFGSSDPDTTGWVLMAFNILGLKDSTQSISAKNWLLTQQSSQDGGFQAFDWGSNTFVSNATTTAQAIIALSEKDWIFKIFTPTSTTPSPSPATTATPTPTPGPIIKPTPTPTSPPVSDNSSSSTPSPTLSPTPPPTSTPNPSPRLQARTNTIAPTPSPSPLPEVLGETTTDDKQNTNSVPQPTEIQQPTLINGLQSAALPIMSVLSLFTTFKFLEGRR